MNQEIYSKNGIVGQLSDFYKWTGNKPKEVSWLWKTTEKETVKVLTLKQESRKKTVKVLDSKTETENRTEPEKLVSPRYTLTWDKHPWYQN